MSITASDVGIALAFAKAIGLAVDPSEMTMRAWAMYFADSPFTAADLHDALKTYRGSDFLTAKAMDDEMRRKRRMRPQDIAADVRSAKARRLVESDWPEDKPLPSDVMTTITEARNAAQDAARHDELEAAEGWTPLPAELLATTGRPVPYGRGHDGYKD